MTSAGFQPLVATLDLTRSETVQRHDFVLTRTYLIPFRIVSPEGLPALERDGVFRGGASQEFGEFDWGMSVVASTAPLPDVMPPTNHGQLEAGIGRMIRRGSRGGRQDSLIPDGMDGVVDVPRLPVELSLLMKCAVLERQTVSTADQIATFTVDGLTIRKSMGSVAGRLVDTRSGQPIGEVRVGLSDLSRGGGGTPVGADGQFDLASAPGFLLLDVHGHLGGRGWMEGYRRWVHIEPGKTLDLGDIALSPGITIQGTVTDENGLPASAQFQALRADLLVHGAPFGSNHYWAMEQPGKLEIPALGRHRYLIFAGNGGLLSSEIAVVDVASPQPLPFNIRLVPCTGVSFVADADDDDFFMAELATSGGDVFDASKWHRQRTARLPPGGYQLSLYDQHGRLARSVPFEVGSEPIEVVFAIDDDGPASIRPQTTTSLSGPNAASSPEPREPQATAKDRASSILMAGHALDRSGTPVPSTSVNASDAFGGRRSALVAADGSFAIAGLRPGRIDVIARAEGCRENHQVIELAAGESARRVDFALERSMRVKVNLVDRAGKPLQKALSDVLGQRIDESRLRVVATFDEPPEWLPSDSLNSFGRWAGADAFRGDSTGTLEVDEPLPVFVSVVFADRVLGTEVLESPKAELQLAADPTLLDDSLSSVRFRLVEALTGEPILRAGVAITELNMSTHPPVTESPEPGGVWSFDRQLPGRRRLCITTESLQYGATVEIELIPDQLNDLGDIGILRDFMLRGRVVDENGRPVKTEVSVGPAAKDGRRHVGTMFDANVSEDGRFIVKMQTPLARVTAGQEWAMDPLFIDVTRLGDTEPTLVVRRGTLVMLRPPRGSRDSIRVSSWRADGVHLFSWTIRGSAPRQVRLVPGTYRLVVEREGAAPEEKSFVVGDDPVEVPLGG